MKGDKGATVKAVALQSGVVFYESGTWKAFKEKDIVNWPAHDAERSASSGVILIDEPAKGGK